jgi:hypothetical protein
LRRGEDLEGPSPWTLRRFGVGRAGGKSREGGIQTPDVATRWRRDPLPANVSAGLGLCRRAMKVQERKCRLSAGYPAGRHGFPVMSSVGERKSKEGHLKLRLMDGTSVDGPQDAERRTGRVEPMTTLARHVRVLVGPCNPRRVGEGCRKAARAVTRSRKTLEDRCDVDDQLLRQASLARGVACHTSGSSKH